MTPERTHPTIGACGIDCGLCPRFHTDGSSRCPGCCGAGFDRVHPSCVIVTCCVKKRSLQTCAECQEHPCAIFDRPATLRDSFVTHRCMRANQEAIRRDGLDAFAEAQAERLALLEEMLARFDDGRSKSVYSLASALLSVDGLRQAVDAVPSDGDVKTRAKQLRIKLEAVAATEKVTLALNR